MSHGDLVPIAPMSGSLRNQDGVCSWKLLQQRDLVQDRKHPSRLYLGQRMRKLYLSQLLRKLVRLFWGTRICPILGVGVDSSEQFIVSAVCIVVAKDPATC